MENCKLLYSKDIAENIKMKIKGYSNSYGTKPCLAIVSVGNDAASASYMKGKIKDCDECGFDHIHVSLSENTSKDMIKNTLEGLSKNKSVHGIILQLPLPKKFNKDDVEELIQYIDPEKDVDCFTNENIGKLFHGNNGIFVPCTPGGIIRLLGENSIKIKGADVCIIGRSDIVGKPLSTLMTYMGATVTVCHTSTIRIEEKMKAADILVVAVGKAGFINEKNAARCVKIGATVIDVGINRNKEGKLVGDCDTEAVSKYAGAITPVPGGVGLMTRTTLMWNVLAAYQNTKAKHYISKHLTSL